jgi:putative ABC transport system permease protein
VRVDPGFSTGNIAALQVFVWDRYRTPERRAEYIEQTLEKIRSLPGVHAAGAVSALPMYEDSIDPETVFTIEGRPESGEELKAFSSIATPDYFSTIGIPLLSGRVFTRMDNRDSAPVVIISSSMARRYWPDEDPVGKKVRVVSFGRPVSREIIGVVGDSRHLGLDSDPRLEFFVPHLQNPYGGMTFVVRTTTDALRMIPVIKSGIWELDKDQPFYATATMEQLVAGTLGQRRFTLSLLASFAVIALGLAAVGTYGLISFSTTLRTREIGVRIALGAQTRDILKLILREGVVLSLAGVAMGLAGSLALTRFLSSLLFETTPTDSLTFAGIALLLFIVAMAAGYIPARRASKVDPMVALRHE